MSKITDIAACLPNEYEMQELDNAIPSYRQLVEFILANESQNDCDCGYRCLGCGEDLEEDTSKHSGDCMVRVLHFLFDEQLRQGGERSEMEKK